MKVAILIPTLGRPHALEPVLDSIKETTPDGQYLPIFVCDWHDHDTVSELHRLGAWWVFQDGTYPVKTNAGYRASNYPLVLPTADDVVFHHGWYEAALDAFQDPAGQVVGTRDLTPVTAEGQHSTMPIVRRSYIQHPGAVWGEPGKVFHEGYHHGWVETELWQLACRRGVARFVPESVIEHLHPDWGTRPRDATDDKGNVQHKAEDYQLFERRRSEWTRHVAPAAAAAG